jgi:hypothetical protein
MVLLRVVAVDLLARLAGLLDHEEARLGLDYAFDPLLLVSRKDDEVVALLDDRVVAGGGNLDRLEARSSATLAVEGQGSGYAVLFGAVLDPLFTSRNTSSLRAARSAKSIV